MSNDEGTTNAAPEATPEVWDRMRALLRSLPAADSISRSANSLEKEAQMVQEFLSQRVPLPQLFVALDQATRLGEPERVSLAAQTLHRCFTSPMGLSLLDDAAVLPSLVGGLRHPEEAVRKLATRVLVQNLQPTTNNNNNNVNQQPLVLDVPPGREARRAALIRRLVGTGDVLEALVVGVADGSIAVGQFSADALLAMMTPQVPTAPTTASSTPQPEEASGASSEEEAAASAALAAMALEGDVAAAVMGRVAVAAGREGVGGDSVLQLRYADLVARAMGMPGGSGEQVLHAAVTSQGEGGGGAADILFRLVEGRDTLIQFSALELLEHVAASPQGVRHLFARGSVQHLLELAAGEQPDPILGGTALRVLGTVYQTLLREPGAAAAALDGEQALQVMSAVVRYAESAREADKLAALQVICAFAGAAADPAPLRRVVEDPVLLKEWLDLRPQPLEMKAAALHALAKVLRGEEMDPTAPTWQPSLPPTPPQTPPTGAMEVVGSAPEETGADAGGVAVSQAELEKSELRRLLFSRLGELNGAGPTMAFVQAQLRAPIPAIRHAVYDVLCAIAGQAGGWGVRAMFTTAGFREFLESRQTELDKEGKEWKYALVSSVVAAQRRVPVLQEEVMEGLRAFLRLGPFFVPRQAEVETMT